MDRLNPHLMPVLFVGHGNPMNALGRSEFARRWRSMVESLPRPRAVLCVSAHWETRGSRVNAPREPGTIHDFIGFPEALYRMRYSCPGAPETALEVRKLVKGAQVTVDPNRGLDHGAWAVLCHMYPEADVPVLQLSLDAARPPRSHYELGRELKPLREAGVLVVGSGNLVHNLPLADLASDDNPYQWAVEFDGLAAEIIEAGDDERLIDYRLLGREAELSIPTSEHFLPLLYTLGLRDGSDQVTFFNESVAHRSVGMRSVRLG